VYGDRVADEVGDVFAAVSEDSHAGEIGAVGAPAVTFVLDDDEVFAQLVGLFRLPCRRILAGVPLGTSLLGLPATVTM
jgi:hypothetical protein